MINFRKKAGYILALTGLTMLFAAGSLFAQKDRQVYDLDGSLQKSFPLKKGGTFSVENVNGQIKIESWNRNEVDVDIVERGRGDSEIEIEFRISNDRIAVKTHHQKRRFSRRNSSAHYTIRVPREVFVQAHSTNGAVTVRDIEGDVEAGTTNGSVTLSGVDGDVRANTTNGDIELYDVVGRVRAETTNQSIMMRNVIAERIDASTTNGGIRADIEVDSNGKYDFSTTNGSIKVTVPEDSEMDVSAHCRSRSFKSDFDIATRWDRDERRRDYSKRNVRGKVNGGGAILSMRTTNGRIDLRKK